MKTDFSKMPITVAEKGIDWEKHKWTLVGIGAILAGGACVHCDSFKIYGGQMNRGGIFTGPTALGRGA